MPDWRKPGNYEFPKDFSREQWAWEFLRRNSEYRKDWDRAKEDRDEDYSPPRKRGEALPQWRGRALAMRLDPQSPAKVLGRKWRLRLGMRDWKQDHIPWNAFDTKFPRFFDLEDIENYFDHPPPELDAGGVLKKRYVILVFDRQSSLTDQLNGAHKLLRPLKIKKPATTAGTKRQEGRTWPKYLRLLDAYETAEKTRAIAEVLYLKGKLWSATDAAERMSLSRRIAKEMKAAKDLRDNPLRILK